MDEQSIMIYEGEAVTSLSPFNDLEAAGRAAEEAIDRDIFEQYHAEIRPNTILRQHDDLRSFARYLEAAGVYRASESLYNDAEAWRGMNYALLRGYIAWALEQGYSVGTINVRLATIRRYCMLAGPKPEGAGVLDMDTLAAIRTVNALGGKKARNVDESREKRGIKTRVGRKKAQATPLKTQEALQLKKVSINPKYDARDALLMGLMIEHALRCGEVASLRIEHFDLEAGMMEFYREKTHRTERHRLKTHTRISAEVYFEEQKRTSGPLFLGRNNQPLTRRAINLRVGIIGKALGVEHLSPHDLRHFWARDALRNGTSIDRAQAGGGWASAHMLLEYAALQGIANDGVIISEE